MHSGPDFVDLFGAPEHWCDRVGREMASPGVMRMLFGNHDERDGNVLRVKLLVPIRVFVIERKITDAFIAAQTARVSRIGA